MEREYTLMVQLINSIRTCKPHLGVVQVCGNCCLSQLWFVVVHNTSPLLLKVYFNLVKGSTVIWTGTTHSELEVICGGLGELLAKPWRTVEGAARAGRTTPLAVPQWVVCVHYICRKYFSDSDCCVTEVVFPDEWWHGSGVGLIGASAWTCSLLAVVL